MSEIQSFNTPNFPGVNRPPVPNGERVVNGTEHAGAMEQPVLPVQPMPIPIHNPKLTEEKYKNDKKTYSDDQLVKAIENALKQIQGSSTHLQFSIHDKTKQIMVKIMDNETGQVIKEIPPEKSFDFLAKVWEMTGLLIDERR